MRPATKLQRILDRMARIETMERGKLCRMTGRNHYNHQAWTNGRNVVRSVPLDRVAALRVAIERYHLFMKLAEQYADEIIRRTRAQQPASALKPRPHPTKGGRPRRP